MKNYSSNFNVGKEKAVAQNNCNKNPAKLTGNQTEKTKNINIPLTKTVKESTKATINNTNNNSESNVKEKKNIK